jgi:hypothetical protein
MTHHDRNPEQVASDADLPNGPALRSLQAALREEAALPLGLRARVEAKVVTAIRHPAASRFGHLAGGCGLFLLLGARPDVVVVGPLAVLLFLAVAAYMRYVGTLDEEDQGEQESWTRSGTDRR